MIPVDLTAWQKWRQQGCTLLPAVAIQPDAAPPSSWARLGTHPTMILLESAQAGRFSYFSDRPERTIWGEKDHAIIVDAAGERERLSGAPLEVLQRLLSRRRAPVLEGWPAMTGGVVGLFGYDLVQTWENLRAVARRDLAIPLYAAIEPRELFIYDHQERRLGVVVWSDVSADPRPIEAIFGEASLAVAAALKRWADATSASDGANVSTASDANSVSNSKGPLAIAPSMMPREFEAAARRVHDYIAAGHTYQVNLSRRTSRATVVAPDRIYEALRRINPSPYMGLFRFPEFALVCGSPELLVKLENGVISSRPIAGTRPRGALPVQDTTLSAELLASEKERAEHLMLVDLIRNDIGRVADYGSVHVPEFMVLERYSHVMHIVSQVEGRLAAGKSWGDVFRSMFPGGTITGCPKIRTMEIIEELEPVGRGFYTGSLGWISYAGEMELNIVIRSMLVQNGIAHVQAGAGVVADSQPERELDESERKAQALWVALHEAEAQTAKLLHV